MTLGQFGGSAPVITRISGGTGSDASELMEEARDLLDPSPEGMPASSQQLAQQLANYGENLLVNGSFESWSAGTTSAPDGWTLTGAGATIARNATDVQFGLASVNFVAALNTATDLAQSITISATQNTRLRGREVTLSCRVKVSTASRVFLRLDDGVLTKDSRFHVGDGNFETLSVTITVDTAATKIEASLEISSGASITGTFDGAKMEVGATATEFSVNPRDPFVQPRSTTSQTNSTTSSSTDADLMTVGNVIVDGTQSVLATFSVVVSSATDMAQAQFRLTRDDTNFVGVNFTVRLHTVGGTDKQDLVSGVALDSKPAAGTYTYKLRWQSTDGASTISADDRSFSVSIIPSA